MRMNKTVPKIPKKVAIFKEMMKCTNCGCPLRMAKAKRERLCSICSRILNSKNEESKSI